MDDHALVRAGLRQVLQGLDAKDPPEVIEAATGEQALVLARFHPDLDLVLLDFHLPDIDGLVALKTLGERHPELPVLILSGSVTPHVVNPVLAAGAAGFVPKSGDSDALLEAIRVVLAGGLYVPRSLGWPAGPQRAAAGAQPLSSPPVLTPRQVDVLRLLVQGCSNHDIATALGLSDETVKTHVSVLLRAFNAKTRVQVMLEAERWGYGRRPFGTT
ncbi:MAG: response regulator transcription factor [Rhodoferax sp.]